MHLASRQEDALDAFRRSRRSKVLLDHLCQRRPLGLLGLCAFGAAAGFAATFLAGSRLRPTRPRFPNPHWRPLHQKVAPTCGAHFTYRWRPLHLHVSREELMDDFLVALHVVRPPGYMAYMYATRPRE